MRFKKNNNFKHKNQGSKFNKSWPSKAGESGSKISYKTMSVDISKIRCYNCNEQDHFATECFKPKQAKKTESDYQWAES